ncbi:hypothetical protein ACFQ60_15230 [Streptomyces zhihengii]
MLNFLHWGGVLGVAFGVLAPLAAILWDRRTHPSTRTREDRKRDGAAKRRTRDRESAHKAVASIARSLVLADYDGALTESEAWRRAWRIEHGTDVLGMTPALRARSVDSGRRFRDAGEDGDGFSPEALAVDALLSDLFPEGESDGSQRPSGGPAKKRGPLGGLGCRGPGGRPGRTTWSLSRGPTWTRRGSSTTRLRPGSLPRRSPSSSVARTSTQSGSATR